MGSGAYSRADEQYVAQTHIMAIVITGCTISSGTTSETPWLETTTGVPSAHNDISDVSSRLKASLEHLGTAL